MESRAEFTIIDDTTMEANGSRTARIQTCDGYTIGTPPSGTVDILDDDTVPTMSVNSPSVQEGDADTSTTVTFTVRLSAVTGRTVTVDYRHFTRTANWNAHAGPLDYENFANGSLAFQPGEIEKTVSVTVYGDNRREQDETFALGLQNLANAVFPGGGTNELIGTATIVDDDPVPTLTVDAPQVREGGPGTRTPMTFTVTLSDPTYQAVRVNLFPLNEGSTANHSQDLHDVCRRRQHTGGRRHLLR